MSGSRAASVSLFSLLFLFTILSFPTGVLAYEVRVNCGGEAYDGDAGHFSADQPYAGNPWGYEGGFTINNWMPIGGTTDRQLYWHVRASDFVFHYRFDVPSDVYDVTLRGVEARGHWHGMNGTRIEAEGQLLIDELDFFNEVERAYALDMRFRVTVTDGRLDLDFIAVEAGAQMAAIEVVTAQMVQGAPSGVEDLEVIPGYSCMIVNWADNPAADLKGYIVSRQILPDGNWVTVQDADFLLSRFIDEDVVEGGEYAYRVSARDLEGLTSTESPAVSGQVRVRANSELRDYEILMTEENLRLLNEDIWSEEYVPADFRWGDLQWLDVGVRYRGHSNRRGPKKNWKVRFYETEIEDMDRLNLNSGYADPSLVREAFGFRLAKLADAYTCRTERVNLYLNGQHRGIHTQIEQVDADWLDARDLENSSPIFKCGDGLHLLPSGHYELYYERKTGPEDDLQPIKDLIETIHLTPDSIFPETISQVVDVYEFMSYYSTLILTGNYDFATHNFYAILDADTERWSFVLWDLDVSLGAISTYIYDYDPTTPIDLGTEEHPDARGFNGLIDRLLEFPIFRWMYAQRMLDLLQGPLSEWVCLSELSRHAGVIDDDVSSDFRKWGWESNELYNEHLNQIWTYLQDRHAFLLSEAEAYQPDIDFAVRINEFLASNTSTNQDESGEYDDWIEIVSMSDEPVDLGGLWLSDDLREPRKWAFPDTVLQPGQFLIVWADDDEEQGPLHTNFKLDRDGEAVSLWDRESEGNVLIDHVVFGYQETDVSMGRIPDGCGIWLHLDPPTPGASNGPSSGIDNSPGNRIPEPRPTDHSAIRVFPNPVVDRVTFAMDGPRKASGRERDKTGSGESAKIILGLFDVQGRRLARVSMAGNPATASIRLREVLGRNDGGVFWVRPLGSPPWPCYPAKVVWTGHR